MRASFPKAALAVTLLLLTSTAAGEEVPEHFTPVRPVGMGGAFTAIANDENAIWTNPAGIARVRKARSRSTFNLTKVPNIIAGANTESRNFYRGFKSSQEKSVEGLVSDTENLSDRPFWARAAVFPVTLFDVTKGLPMSAGLYSNTTLKAVIQKDTPEEANVEAISDLGAVLGFAFTNQSNRFNIGLQFRPVYRYAYEDRMPSENLTNQQNLLSRIQEGANMSTGIGVDFGMMFTMADFWFPTIGFSIMNLPTGCRQDYLNPFTEKRQTICGNVYRGDISNEEALSAVDPTDVRIGISITPRLTQKIAARVALDMHHIPIPAGAQYYGLPGIDASKLLHAGVELFVGNPLVPSPFSLRAGYSQGFATVGATINVSYVHIELASYGRDVSSSQAPLEDRRILGSASLDF